MRKKKNNILNFSDNSIDYTLLITILLLLSLGLIMVLSASSPTALSESGNSYTYFAKQGAFAIVGLFCMFVISKINYIKMAMKALNCETIQISSDGAPKPVKIQEKDKDDVIIIVIPLRKV